MQKSAWILAILVSLAQVAIAQSTVPHPRLILDAATLGTLRARAQANTSQWQALKSYCDSFIGGVVNYPDGPAYPSSAADIGQGYEGDGYWAPLMSEGLCYQVMRGINATAAAPYGAKAADIAVKMSVLYPATHGEDPCTDNGYVIRFYGVGMGILYDWAYDALTPNQRTQIYTTANSWLNNWETNACSSFEYVHPQSNYFAGYFHAKTVIALATAGDNPNAPALWADWNNAQFNTAPSNPPHIGVQPYYAAHMTGGGWPEGFGNYGPLATLNMSLPAWEVKTATGTDLIHAANPYSFPLDAADYLMHFTWPSLDYIDDRDTNHSTGDASAPPPGTASAGMFMQVLGTLRYWNAPHANVFQQYANEVIAATSNDADAWEAFLFYDPNGTTAPLSTLGLSYFATGLNAVAARSDWTTSATWMSFRAGPYVNNPNQGEEGYDQGSLALVRGGTPLLVNGSGWIVHEPGGSDDENRLYTDLYGSTDGTVYSGNRTIYNIFYARQPGPGGYARYGQASYTAEDNGVQTQVAAFEDGVTYVYALATHLEQMYVPGPTNAQVADWSREIVYLRPNRVIVYDRSGIGSGVTDQFLAFHFPANPTAGTAPSGESRYDVSYNATYAGALTTVLPANATTTIIPMYPANGTVPASNPVKVWQSQVRSPNTNANQVWLNVFDLAASSATVATASKINVTAGSVTGTLLADANGNQAVLFNTGSAGSTIAGTISYSLPAAATAHYITEVPANTGYAVTVSVNAGTHSISITPGGRFYSSAKGVLSFTVSAAGAVGPGDRIFANGFD
ncbi:MAG: hypothetical protein KGI64_11380 [Xanthomonadaceae bacterium]|nr:hypothetical protein [Xanthomonadaceae bacterium]MDE2256540.1 hypothetical protein [Xanthomonadaceae bacterium]